MEGISLRPTYGKKTTSSPAINSTQSQSTADKPTARSNNNNNNNSNTNNTRSKSPISRSESDEGLNKISTQQPHRVQEKQETEPDTTTNEEKSIYSRSYLMKFQDVATEMPTEINTIIEEIPQLKRQAFVFKSPELRPRLPGQQSQQRTQTGQQQQRRPQQREQFSKRAANPWNPLIVSEKDTLFRTITGTLNKMTPENFDKLSIKLNQHIGEITTLEMYKETVSHVFTKAVSEVKFSKMYADLCVKLNGQKTKIAEPNTDFRRVLLNQCQQEFEATFSEKADAEKSLPTDPEEREFVISKDRKRKLGNIKFVGELFKCKLLSEKIIHVCITTLINHILKSKDKTDKEFFAELLCKLLSNIGKLIDLPQAQTFMNSYFLQVQKLCADNSLSSRIRFMLQDVIELRANQWVPRHKENGPKLISEVHAEAAVKEFEEPYVGASPKVSPRGLTTSTGTSTGELKSALKSSSGTSPSKSRPVKESPRVSVRIPSKDKIKNISEAPVSKAGSAKDDDYHRKINEILEDYLISQDDKETAEAITELKSPEKRNKVVENGIMMTVEKSGTERDLMQKLFAFLSSQQILNEDNFVKGFQSIAEHLSDLEVDVPGASKYVQQFKTSAVTSNCISASLAAQISVS